jgi:hypothetical protein
MEELETTCDYETPVLDYPHPYIWIPLRNELSLEVWIARILSFVAIISFISLRIFFPGFFENYFAFGSSSFPY